MPADMLLQVLPLTHSLSSVRNTLNLGTKRLNSWCQLLSVEAGEMIKNGPQMLSLCVETEKRIQH